MPSTQTTRSADSFEAIEDLGEADNTLFIYVFGDNGSSAEGGLAGTFNEMVVLNGLDDSVEDQLEHLDEFGGPMAYNHFHAGWAVAGNTPFQWAKQVASHYGGTRNPMVIHWPEGDGGERGGAFAVASRDRHCSDRHGRRGAAVSRIGRWRDAEAVRRRELTVFVR